MVAGRKPPVHHKLEWNHDPPNPTHYGVREGPFGGRYPGWTCDLRVSRAFARTTDRWGQPKNLMARHLACLICVRCWQLWRCPPHTPGNGINPGEDHYRHLDRTFPQLF